MTGTKVKTCIHNARKATNQGCAKSIRPVCLCQRTSSHSRMLMRPGGDVTCFDGMKLAAGEMKSCGW